ncbi:MAG: MFS transporter, partial [Hyphomicrobiaceae bacterium]
GWRGSWILAAASLGCFTLPLLLVLLSQERTPQSLAATQTSAGLGGRHWRRDEAMRHWLIWALLPGILAPSFMITALFFHQVHIADVKGWTLADYVTVYPLYSGVAVACNLVAGQAIDRYGSARLLPFLLLPMVIGLALYGTFDGFWIAWVGLSAIAVTQGCSHSVLGSIWAEYYGTANLGAIRSLVIAFSVAASALGPGVTGWLIDVDIDIETQCIAMAVYLVVASGFLYFVRRAAEFLRYPD